MLKIPELAINPNRKVTTVCNGEKVFCETNQNS